MWFIIYNNLNVHVGDSDIEVIRRTLKRLKRKSRYGRSNRTERHKLLRGVLKEHKEARALYTDVMWGRTSKRRRRR